MSLFFPDSRGIYIRAFDGGISDIARAKQFGFRWAAINTEYPLEQWQIVIERCQLAGLTVIPWQRLYTPRELFDFCELASNFPACILNLEKELDYGTITPDDVNDAAQGLDACISTEPWLFESLDWSELATFPIHLQLFPQENMTSWDPRACRAHAYAMGAERCMFMHGIHDLLPEDFVLQGSYGVYVADDMEMLETLERDYAAWAEQKVAPLVLPYTGPLYGPSKRKVPSKCKTAKALKMAMHALGFGTYTNPDLFYNRNLERDMKRMQVLAGIQPTGQYGMASYEYLRRALHVTPREGRALSVDAIRLIEEDARDG